MAVIVVSTNDADWLSPCLETLYARAGDVDLDVAIADNESTDGTAELIARDFPQARVVPCRNRGFGHANNRALMTCDARYVLFLNPDTEVIDGTLADLVAIMDARPEIGMAGVRQITADGALYPTLRRFPNALRALGEAFGADRLPWAPEALRTRVHDEALYDREVGCDWTTGSFMLVRREALVGAGAFDERFFMSSEEVDLALRIKQAGWDVMHLPQVTIVHHVHMGESLGERMQAQYALARRQYADKNFSTAHRALYLQALKLNHRLRVLRARLRGGDAAGDRRALRMLRGAEPWPYMEPPAVAVAPEQVPRAARR